MRHFLAQEKNLSITLHAVQRDRKLFALSIPCSLLAHQISISFPRKLNCRADRLYVPGSYPDLPFLSHSLFLQSGKGKYTNEV